MLRQCSNTVVMNNTTCQFLNDLYLLQTRNIKNTMKNTIGTRNRNKILQDSLGFPSYRVTAIMRDNPRLKNLDANKLTHTINTLKKFGINRDDISKHPLALKISSTALENSIMYLKETGFEKISLDILLRFRLVVRKPIYMFKDHKAIPENINVPERLFTYLDPRPVDLPILNQFSESDSILKVHDLLYKHYLAWRFGTSVTKVEKHFRKCDKFRYSSFELLSKLLKLLLDDVGFSNSKLLSNPFLCQLHPDFIENLINAHPTLAGIDIKKILVRFPKLLAIPTENFSEMIQHFKAFDVPDKAIQKCFEVFTLSPDTVLSRLNEIRTIPEFKVLMKNPRIVHLILNQNKAKARLEHLQQLKVKCASIHVLCGTDNIFDKYIQDGNGKTRGFDVTKSLGTEFDVPNKKIREKLSINPNWCHVPLTTIQDSLRYLLGRGFIKEDIYRTPVILLYRREKLEEAFEEMARNPESNKKISPTQQLSLCLYFIEQKHHFSGDGIWQNSSNLEVTEPQMKP